MTRRGTASPKKSGSASRDRSQERTTSIRSRAWAVRRTSSNKSFAFCRPLFARGARRATFANVTSSPTVRGTPTAASAPSVVVADRRPRVASTPTCRDPLARATANVRASPAAAARSSRSRTRRGVTRRGAAKRASGFAPTRARIVRTTPNARARPEGFARSAFASLAANTRVASRMATARGAIAVPALPPPAAVYLPIARRTRTARQGNSVCSSTGAMGRWWATTARHRSTLATPKRNARR
jgi:hypothetical protein